MTSPNGDQHQFSRKDIHTLSREWELMKRSLKRKCLDLSSNPLNTFFMEMYRDQFGEFVFGYWRATMYSNYNCFYFVPTVLLG